MRWRNKSTRPGICLGFILFIRMPVDPSHAVVLCVCSCAVNHRARSGGFLPTFVVGTVEGTELAPHPMIFDSSSHVLSLHFHMHVLRVGARHPRPRGSTRLFRLQNRSNYPDGGPHGTGRAGLCVEEGYSGETMAPRASCVRAGRNRRERIYYASLIFAHPSLVTGTLGFPVPTARAHAQLTNDANMASTPPRM